MGVKEDQTVFMVFSTFVGQANAIVDCIDVDFGIVVDTLDVDMDVAVGKPTFDMVVVVGMAHVQLQQLDGKTQEYFIEI